jgi:hypothetical protein
VNKLLTDIIYQYKENNFKLGIFDCCIFTASVIEEYTGKDLSYWKNLVNYHDIKGANKLLKELNCNSLKDFPDLALNTSKKPISEVELGDLVYYINENGDGILGICNGQRAYFLQTNGGLTARNIEECEFCWSVK